MLINSEVMRKECGIWAVIKTLARLIDIVKSGGFLVARFSSDLKS